MIAPRRGMIPKILRRPGALEKPMVLNNSPWSALVCGSARNFVPIKYVRYAQTY